MSVGVYKKVVRIQRDFLWGGVGNGNKLARVKWRKICRPKAKGGLGVKDVRMVNISLLAKLKWHLLWCDRLLCKEVLIAKYDEGILRGRDFGYDSWPNFSSTWWKDAASNLHVWEAVDWFKSEIYLKVGNGRRASFWRESWFENSPLCKQYPRLFSPATDKDAKVEDMRVRERVICRWTWSLRRGFFSFFFCVGGNSLKIYG